MISRRTALALAKVFEKRFRSYQRPRGSRSGYYIVDDDGLYDFLFQHDYSAWFCNMAKTTRTSVGTRKLEEFIMKLHTGETQCDATPNWTWEQRQQLGQQYLHNLAEDILDDWSNKQDPGSKDRITTEIKTLLGGLELDGYIYRDSRLLAPESDVLDAREEAGILESLYTSLALGNKETALHHLTLSEEHYLASRWDDSIANSRKFLECVLREVAAAYSLRCNGVPLSDSMYAWPVRVREYLEHEGLLETKEKEAIASVYGLLSETGGHPYMARNDQARLLRHLALTLSQFVMLRFQGSLRRN